MTNRRNTSMKPSPIAQQVIVRAMLYHELKDAQYDGIKLGRVVLVPPKVIQAEMERRIEIDPHLPFAWC